MTTTFSARVILIVTTLIASALFLSVGVAHAAGPAPVNLLSAGNFVILSKTGITNTGSHTTLITGNIGSSPITAAAMNNVFCSEIAGTIYGVDAAYVGSGDQTCFAGNPPLANKTLVDNAVLDMGTAYADAAGRPFPDGTELFAGNLGGQTFAPGLYKWSTDVTIPTNVTLSGGPDDVWIFQIAGNLSIASGASVPAGIKVVLIGGARASNVFWQVGGVTGATLGTYSTFNGNILSAKQIIIQTGAVLNGRALAETQVTLDANRISVPVTEDIVSDTNTMIGGDNAVAILPHPAWTASIPGATWIWQASSTPPDATVSFEKTFTVACEVLSAHLDIAADNSYKVFIDGVEVAADASANNFTLATQDSYDLTSVVTPGTHTLRIDVTNVGVFNANSNPAGLLYRFVVESQGCPPPPSCPCECANEHEVGEVGYDSPYITHNGISIKVTNSGCIFNTTDSSASTGGNTAEGSRGGRGGRGGDVEAEANNGGDANGNNGGALAGDGGAGGNASAGGLVDTGNATSVATTTNSLNGTDIELGLQDFNSSTLEVDIENKNCTCNLIDNKTRSRARTGGNTAEGSRGGSGGSGGEVEAEADGGDANGNNGGSVAGNGGNGGSGATGGTVHSGVADSFAGTTNMVNFTRIRLNI